MATTLITTPAVYHRRVLDGELDELMSGLPAIAVEGAKAVGNFRAYGGEREVDLIVKGESGRVIAIKVKLAATPSERDGSHAVARDRRLRKRGGPERREVFRATKRFSSEAARHDGAQLESNPQPRGPRLLACGLCDVSSPSSSPPQRSGS
jgi:hypothetical protein